MRGTRQKLWLGGEVMPSTEQAWPCGGCFALGRCCAPVLGLQDWTWPWWGGGGGITNIIPCRRGPWHQWAKDAGVPGTVWFGCKNMGAKKDCELLLDCVVGVTGKVCLCPPGVSPAGFCWAFLGACV